MERDIRSQDEPKKEIKFRRIQLRIEDEIRKTDDYGNLQKILDRYSDNTIRKCLLGGNSDSVKRLTTVCREAGFYFRTKEANRFERVIKENKIPIRACHLPPVRKNGKVYPKRYIIVLAKHKEKIAEIFNNEPSLQEFKRNPVRLAYGEWDGKLPTTNLQHKKDDYASLSRLRISLNGSALGTLWRKKHSDLLVNCPVPIFETNKRYFYPKNREEDLRKFLKEKLGIV